MPAQNVGGDYYDFIQLDDHRIAIGVGDVSGKGLGAALIMANLQATIRSQALLGLNPDKCLENANSLLYESTDARTFISLFFGIIDTKSNTFVYSNAGQDTPICIRADGSHQFLNTHGLALGIKNHCKYQKEQIALKSSDIIMIYTDGIREAMNKKNIEFGETSIVNITKANSKLHIRDIINSIFHSIELHLKNMVQQDDMTLVAIKRS